MMPRRVPRAALTLVVVAIAAVAAAVLVVTQELPDGLRGLIGVVLLILLPGYAAMRALFAARELEPAESAAVTLGLGIALAVCGGLILNVTPSGLTAPSWAVYLAAFTVVASAIAIVRGSRATSAATTAAMAAATAMSADAPGRRRPSRDQVAMLVLAAIVAAAALFVARDGANHQQYPGFTQLWMLPDEPGSVTVGVRDVEGDAQTYRLELTVDGQPFSVPSSVALIDQQSWQETVAVGTPPSGKRVLVQADLFRASDTVAYRTVYVTLGDLLVPPTATPSAP